MLASELSVLLVEDNPVEVSRLRELLSRASRVRLQVTEVGSLAAARVELQRQSFSVILLDWTMPGQHGVVALKRLQEAAPRTPVLMLVGWDDDEASVSALRAGAQDVLVKENMTSAGLERVIRFAVERKRSEAVLRQTEEMYRSLIESLPLNVFRKDEQGRFVFANQRFCNELHKRLDELIGQTDYAFFPAPLAEKYRHDDVRVLQEKHVFEDIEEHLTPDGQRIFVQVMKAPATDVSGRVVGTQAMFWDVTARVEAERALQRSNARFRRLFESNIIGIILADLSGRILEANDAFLSIVGYSRDDLAAGRLRWDWITPPEFLAMDEKAVERLRKTGVCPPWEKEYLRKDRGRVPVLVGVSMLDNSSDECICFVLDMTQQKQAAEQLRRAKEQADAASEAKSLFLANMSHEIRTPMNAIIGLTDMVLDTALTPEQRDHLTAVAESAEALLSLINHILDFSKIEAGKLDLDEIEFSLRSLVAGTLKTLAFSAHRKNLELVGEIASDLPDRLVGDVVRLRQIVLNLLGNAIKFTDAGEVVLSVKSLSRDARSVVLQIIVQDTGIGIPVDRQERIFEAFEQVHKSINRRYGGSGLGLSITAKLAELMGGRISVASDLGRGSRFTVNCRLKLASDVVPVAPPTTAPSPFEPLSGLRALVVDDNASSRRQLTDLLVSWRLLPTGAESAQAALKLLESAEGADNHFAFTLLDTQMPGTDGYELATTIRTGPGERAGLLMALLSSPDRASEMNRCEQFGFAAVIAKPVNESELLDTLLSLRFCERSVAEALSHEPTGAPSRPSLRVLLAEDSLYNQKLAVALLTRRGHQVTVAHNGREALEMVFERPFDRVLMDVQMPEMDGLEATRRIRERELRIGSHIPIIAMTAQAMMGDRERCLAAGMDDYLTKPIRPEQVFASLEKDWSNARSTIGRSHARPTSNSLPDAAVRRETLPERNTTAVAAAPNGERPARINLREPSASPRTAAVYSPTLGQHQPTAFVNWSHALEAVGGDDALLREIVACCLTDFPRWLSDLDQSVATNDCGRFRRAAHSIRGACRTFGVENLSPPTQDLEMLAAAGNLVAAGELWQSLRTDVCSCMNELQNFLTQQASADCSPA